MMMGHKGYVLLVPDKDAKYGLRVAIGAFDSVQAAADYLKANTERDYPIVSLFEPVDPPDDDADLEC